MRKCGKRPWRRWTPDEDDLIREHYPERGARWRGWADMMPERLPTYDDVAHRARAIGVKCNHAFRYGKGKERGEVTPHTDNLSESYQSAPAGRRFSFEVNADEL